MNRTAWLLILGLGVVVVAIAAWQISTRGSGSTSGAVITAPAAPAAPATPVPATAPVGDGPLTIGINANSQGYGADAGNLQDRVMKTGVRWLREELDWDRVEPERGHYDWTNYDDLYRAAAQRGLHVLPLIIGTPKWAGASSTTIPADPAPYAAFTTQVVRRYGPGGAFWATHPRLPATASEWFELWNEPYIDAFSAGHPDPAAYARLVAAAGAAAHAANPGAKVLIASNDTPVAQQPDGRVESWTDAMYAAVPQLNRAFDGVAVHPYVDRAANLAHTRRDFVAHGAQAKPFWLTEIGWSTCPAGANARCVSEADQARLVTQLFDQLDTTYASYVRAVFLYHYNDQPNGGGHDPEAFFGLTRADGSPKPAYAAFQAAIASRRAR